MMLTTKISGLILVGGMFVLLYTQVFVINMIHFIFEPRHV